MIVDHFSKLEKLIIEERGIEIEENFPNEHSF